VALGQAAYTIRRAVKDLQPFTGQPNIIYDVNVGEWLPLELGEGIPAYFKVFLKMKKPPLVIEFDYLKAAHSKLNFYGSFVCEEPSAKDNFIAYHGRPQNIKIDPTRGKGKTFGTFSHFYFSIEGPLPVRMRAKFKSNLNEVLAALRRLKDRRVAA
jgi:hypothetical protein